MIDGVWSLSSWFWAFGGIFVKRCVYDLGILSIYLGMLGV